MNTDRIGSSFDDFLKEDKAHNMEDTMNTETISIKEYDKLRKIRDNLDALKKEVEDGRDLIKVESSIGGKSYWDLHYEKKLTYIGKDEAIKLLEDDHNRKIIQCQERINQLENDLRVMIEGEKNNIKTASFLTRLKYLFTCSLD